MSIYEYEQMHERLAFLKILDLAERDIARGAGRPVAEVAARIRAKLEDPAA